ncbi:hypothetical protein TELCIR_11764 [Teladorsagia circumcincta]|uniref:Pyrroline-5-carboxylate reductase catalytic N-terminal domain-containing protein n=1 Tax=Teladorsagia circumcincta TaxID=45464 RepID=A0A2G9U8B6_TELCI|nr:hypothetical protein TELCIR_11764 [Teladorsagia circumcincta]
MSEFSRLCQAAGIMKPMFLFIGGGNMASALIHGCIESGIVVLAVKPQSRQAVYDSLTSNKASLDGCPLIISILAGIDIPTLKAEAGFHSTALEDHACIGPVCSNYKNS